MNTLHGYTKKLTIYSDKGPVDAYLKIGLVGPSEWGRFPHLCVGDICYLDLTVSKQSDELRVYEVLMEMSRKVISCGGNVTDVARVLIGQNFPPQGPTADDEIHTCKSLCDYIGKYLMGRR